MDKVITGGKYRVAGELTVPGDKSISHRSVMLGALSDGVTHVKGFLNGADCLSTISCFRKMGIDISLSEDETEVIIRGKGMHGLTAPQGVLDCGNSGTTTRLISGILAAQDFDSSVTGDESIQKRPMKRIMTPLLSMGADIRSVRDNGCAPLQIRGRKLHGICYESPVASAQVKSAVLFAGLYAAGETRIIEPSLSRNHSELMLQALGADVSAAVLPDGRAEITLEPCNKLTAMPGVLQIPADISSAAYFISAALLLPDSELLLRNVGINPTRAGILDVYRMMGADIAEENRRLSGFEEIADLRVRYSRLHGTEIGGAMIPRLIDELPMIAALAAAADGVTVIRDAAELKVKESNRIRVMVSGLRACGIRAEETEDGMIIYGQGENLRPDSAVIDTCRDHRIAMTFAVLGLKGTEKTELLLRDADCIAISYPNFYKDLLKVLDKN